MPLDSDQIFDSAPPIRLRHRAKKTRRQAAKLGLGN